MKRRKFIKTNASAAMGAAAFSVVPSTILGKTSGHNAPSDKVNLACCGIGHRGGSVVKALYETGLANVVALCDVDMGAKHTLEVIEMSPMFPDFRILEKFNLDLLT